jgi:NAD(P)-dependent dehydrogenase (short-subunit alcohol dehydrogenase family)
MNKKQSGKNVMITGVSSGIGLGLTRESLGRGFNVFGTARHAPELGKNDLFRFVPCDLSREKEIPAAIKRLVGGVAALDLVILNAGVLGPIGDLHEQPLDEIQRVMQVNVWANKTILDELFTSGIPIGQVALMSSGAGVHAHRGWGGYAISKAALNMLTGLAATEHPETHFSAVGPGLVDTAMQDQLCSLASDPRFPSLDRLRARRGTAEMPDGQELAPRLLEVILRLPDLIPSGTFADVRQPPLDAIPAPE